MAKKYKCLNDKCPSHETGFKYVKIGTVLIKARKTRVQRYKCKDCNKTFLGSSFKETPTFQKDKQEERDKIQQLFCSGMTLRSIAKFLKISRSTVDKRIKEIAEISKANYYNNSNFKYRDNFLRLTKKTIEKIESKESSPIKKPVFVFDEMETHLISPLMPLSIGVMHDYVNDVIVSIKVCGFKPRNVSGKLKLNHKIKSKYKKSHDFDFNDHRSDLAIDMFNDLNSYSKNAIRKDIAIITDGKTNYPNAIKTQLSFPKIHHEVFATKGVRVLDDDESPEMLDENDQLRSIEELRPQSYFKALIKAKYNPYYVSAFAKFNKICSIMRMNLATLHRKSFCTIKDVNSFQDQLYVFQDWYNKRELSKEERKTKEYRELDRVKRKGF